MSRPPTPSKKPVPMCCVSIGHSDYLMPADKGMKLVDLLQSAFATRKDFGDRNYFYVIGDQPEVEFALVRPSQIRQQSADTNGAGQRLLGVNS